MADYLFLPDPSLWKMVQEGDKDVFTYIYRKYATELYRYGIKICPDPILVEDVLQEVFCRLWDLKNDISIDRSIKFYLFSTFRRELVKQASKQSNTASLCHQNLTPQLEYSLQEILIENQITLESNQKMEKAMDALSKRQKEAIYLKYIEGLSYEEISKLMNIQVPSLYNLIFKALKFLKNHLLQNKFLRNVQGIFLFDQILTFLFN
jgi:RNA polymerase sigma factor (sigma-70 family)